jgi:hypothetical protein
VLANAQTFLLNGTRYAYDELLLLGLICLAKDVPNDLFKGMIAISAKTIDDLLAHGTKKPMICSELVYRCYASAHVGLGVTPVELDKLVNTANAFEKKILNMLGKLKNTTDDDFVTPNDLGFSSVLSKVFRYTP